jgi:flavin-binding protein dodecin
VLEGSAAASAAESVTSPDRRPEEAVPMSDHVYRVTEIVGSSATSVDDAIRNAATRAAKTLHHLDWFEVTGIRGHFEDESIAHVQVTMKVGFRLDDDE